MATGAWLVSGLGTALSTFLQLKDDQVNHAENELAQTCVAARTTTA